MARLTAWWLDWQKALPALVVLLGAAWLAGMAGPADGDRSWFLLLLIVYMVHQIEEHLWPGGFRQFANAHVFHTGLDAWPVGRGGVAFVNVVLVWAPIAAAVLMPQTLRAIGIIWMGLTAVNALIHVVTSIRLRRLFNPGVVTSVLLFLPFTLAYFAERLASGALSGAEVAVALVFGALLHVPVAMVFVIPFRRGRKAAEAV